MLKPNIFETAIHFSRNKHQYQLTAIRTQLIRDLMIILDNAPYMSNFEKKQIKTLIPVLSNSVLKNIRESLIRQGLRLTNQQP